MPKRVKRRRLADVYTFPGFRPHQGVQGMFGYANAWLVTFIRRGAAPKVHAAPAIARRRWTIFGLEALGTGPRFDQRAIDGQMFRGQKIMLSRDLDDGFEDPLRQASLTSRSRMREKLD